VRVADDTFVPCDMLLLASSDAKGISYVETKNLDGETNLKIKNVHKDMNNLYSSEKDLSNIEGMITCEAPNGNLYKFEGQANMNLKGMNATIAINPENVLLRGMSVRNTEFIYGLVIFAGPDTKVMKNSTKAKYKFSKLEILVNKSMIIVFLL
jgi:magnesium-transporting ATPase (P-type)